MKKHQKYGVVMSDWLLLAAILDRWRRPVASVEALDLLHRAMRTVSYRRTTKAIEMASEVGALFVVVRFYRDHGGHRGKTEQIFARWRSLVDSGKALNSLHWAMRSV